MSTAQQAPSKYPKGCHPLLHHFVCFDMHTYLKGASSAGNRSNNAILHSLHVCPCQPHLRVAHCLCIIVACGHRYDSSMTYNLKYEMPLS